MRKSSFALTICGVVFFGALLPPAISKVSAAGQSNTAPAATSNAESKSADAKAVACTRTVKQFALAARNSSEVSCLSAEDKGFQILSGPEQRAVASFIAKPDDNAGVEEIRNQFIYLHILGRYASDRLFSLSARQCAFGTTLEPSFDLDFQLFNIGQNVHGECSFRKCVSMLSDVLQSMVPNQRKFSETVTKIANALGRPDSVYLKYRTLGAHQAIKEAYRHIYAVGTKQRILADLSSTDFLNADFNAFATWFKAQQMALHNARRNGGRLSSTREPPDSKAQHGDDQCSSKHDVNVQQLNIDHYGWGQRSIIMISQGFRKDSSIDNALLRAVCSRDEQSGGHFTSLPWREMIGISCIRERFGRDRWLVLYSKEGPPATTQQMGRYARGIAYALNADKCVRSGLAIFVINFSQHQ